MDKNGEKKYDMNFNDERVSHTIMASILSRTLDPNVLTEKEWDYYISKLKSMVGAKYFQEHNKVKHGSSCPEESVNIFKLPEAMDTQSYMEEMTTKEFPNLLSDTP